ncbi:MAG: hypothetical protein ACYTG0_45355, partial [Planctomycetota bacterium]|jgi:hypothetical protein
VPDDAKDLLCSLVWQRRAGALLENLGMPRVEKKGLIRVRYTWLGVRRCYLKWHTRFLDSRGRPRRVFLFQRPEPGNWGTIVTTDDGNRLIQWKEVRVGMDFISARVKTAEGTTELSIAANPTGVRPVWAITSHATYRFLLDDNEITARGFQWNKEPPKPSIEQTELPPGARSGNDARQSYLPAAADVQYTRWLHNE